jgi:hypothetical protein
MILPDFVFYFVLGRQTANSRSAVVLYYTLMIRHAVA